MQEKHIVSVKGLKTKQKNDQTSREKAAGRTYSKHR